MKKAFLIVILVFLAAGCATTVRPPLKEDLLSNEDEKIIWRRSLEEQKSLNAGVVILQDKNLEDYLDQIVQKLQPEELPPGMSFKVVVVKDPYLNAFAFPNGIIYVHTGLLARMDNEAQLAGLLAHEMAHCTQRHTLRALRSITDKPAFMVSAQQTLAGLSMIQEVVKFLGLTGSMTAVTGYVHELESEADTVGLDYMVLAGYDPYEVLRLFEHLKREIEHERITEPFFFGTHPKVQARIDTIMSLLETKHKDKRGGIKNTELFLSKVNQAILENARLDLRIGRFDIAQSGVEKYLRIKKNDARAYYLIGEIYRQRGEEHDYDKALAYYQKAILIDSSYAEPHKAIGLIHYKEGQRVLAKKFFESCLLLAPDTPDKAYIQGYIKKCVNDREG
jgi:hypothetical protein